MFVHKNTFFMKCHNCGASMSLESFIKTINPSLYNTFRLEKWKEDNGAISVPKKNEEHVPLPKQYSCNDNPFSGLPTIESLPDNHVAKAYIINRKIPETFYSGLYYTDTFQDFTNSIAPETFPTIEKDEPRIIIPFLDEDGKAFAYQGRSLSKDSSLRYITIKIDESMPKVYGLDRFDPSQRSFVVEGPFDSMFLPNCIAMGGADLSTYPVPQSAVWIFDNERRNREILVRMEHIIQQGYSLVIWPNSVTEKDINDMVLTQRDVLSIVNANIFSGMRARLRLKEWRRL